MSTPEQKPILHHLVYGTLVDCINGEKRIDTDDERIRQEIARFMMDEKGFSSSELTPRLTITTRFNARTVVSTIDLTIIINNMHYMIVRYGPGSLVSRERSAIAAARVLTGHHQIPFAVVTNGRDAEIIDTATGKIIDDGLLSIPTRDQAYSSLDALHLLPCPQNTVLEREMRILNAFDVERCCLPETC